MFVQAFLLSFLAHVQLARSLVYTPEFEAWNLNTNQDAQHPLDYSGIWDNHTFHPSPSNWRFPVYTLFLDKFVNGDPQNDNANGTIFEQDITSTQFRHGGDVQGLIDSLDYIQGFGIKAIYIAGSPFINLPWGSDQYSPLDLTLLDQHFGNIEEWRRAVDAIHERGMYVILDNTVATMGDLIGFEGYLNESTPFDTAEHEVLWKGTRRYLDFAPSNGYNETCEFPRFWNETGYPVDDYVNKQFKGCYNGDFDQFGDTEAFGVFPDYRRQLTKFASVQDRLREWVPSVRERLEHFSCITIRMLDIDGFRFDKAIQVTVDASGNFSSSLRQCARDVGKKNFFLPGEITGGNNMGSVYLGRGRQPDQYLDNMTTAVTLTNNSDDKYFLRDHDQGALDAGAFHYSVYRFLTRFLGMDGNLEAGYDLPPDWVDAWNQMLLSNDFVNPNTGAFDPRHMYGATNQDVFRWPAIHQGIDRFLLGQFITGLLMPGIPLLLWGEEVAFNVLDNTADNYIFGRQAMSPSPAWYMHGCYALNSTQYYHMPLESARDGCKDITNTYDHRDPSHPIRVIIRHMYHLRAQFPTLNDGLTLQKLSKQTDMIKYPGSSGVETETGLWSVRRAPYDGVQNFGGPSDIWLVYHNRNETTKYSFDCSSNDSAIISPFDSGVTVKNLLFPHDELNLIDGPIKLGLNGSKNYNGCVKELEFAPYEFRLYVPTSRFAPPPPMITKFLPGHDYQYLRESASDNGGSVNISLHFNAAMDCKQITQRITIDSRSFDNMTAAIDMNSVSCGNTTTYERAPYVGAIASAWSWSARLLNVSDGIHRISVKNATTADGGSSTESTDNFLIRVGKADNPIVHLSANYSQSLLSQDASGKYSLTHKAAGADKYRYSLNWGSSWSDWENLEQVNVTLAAQPWSGTEQQKWKGSHVMVQYWSQLLGSSSFMQHGDVDFQQERRFPHLFANGPFNQFGFDAGVKNQFAFQSGSKWSWHFMNEWPSTLQLNVWGMNPDGQPDKSFVYGDIDGDGVLDRLTPASLLVSALNITTRPPSPYLAYRVDVNDGNLQYKLVPVGNQWLQLALFIVLWISPLAMGLVAVGIFQGSFYKVKYVTRGVGRTGIGAFLVKMTQKLTSKHRTGTDSPRSRPESVTLVAGEVMPPMSRRKVLIATIEYNIDDWNIKVKIGGLGVMAQLMGKALSHLDLIWVVPCVEGIEYPDVEEERAEPMVVKILDNLYTVTVHYHVVNNITFVVLDAPIFRTTDKANPYPPRMDDISSAIYYSTWNQCIAQAIERFDVNLYHINDYHGAAAPLYLLPKTIPCCLSLHNAEFQGLWPMRTADERNEVSRVFNLPSKIVKQYVQFGSVFNLLHAGASYLRIHQAGFGAVGVSKKYGDRSFARYPIFWGLPSIGQLPNPDPSDVAEWDKGFVVKKSEVKVDKDWEAQRGQFRVQAQEWAGLEIDAEAQLFVFVGRWSEQKGVDLIADIFPSILEDYPKSQLICVGPVIDLYGKFAALKLSRLMEQYPKRVFSKPEFTMLPPYIHTGAEFALIPSRDEPFGLVAVEFGRKGALGVGARVGGLGQMPGWWYTVESTSSTHLLKQFKLAIVSALESKESDRAMMRAWSAKQRFPVAQWLEGLGKLQDHAVRQHEKHHKISSGGTGTSTPQLSVGRQSKHASAECSADNSRAVSAIASPVIPSSSRTSIHELDLETGHGELLPPRFPPSAMSSRPSSVVNLAVIVGERKDFALQQVDPFFTDSDEAFYNIFKKKLSGLNARNSTTDLCTEEYIVESTRSWFSRRHDAKVGTSSLFSPGRSLQKKTLSEVQVEPMDSREHEGSDHDTDDSSRYNKEASGFDFGENYVRPTGLKKYLQVKIGTWPIYSFMLALGQIIASNSYQITLLTGEIGQSANKLYVIASVYLGFSLIYFLLTRYVKLLYLLTVPFFLYGSAFLLVGTSPFIQDPNSRYWMQNIATGVYAAASASGSLFFAFNFGDEGGAPITTWIWRACWIQALQHAYTLALWFWGSYISSASAQGDTTFRLPALPILFPITLVIALGLWSIGIMLFIGLPTYYRQMPDQVPSLLKSIVNRKITLWFFVAVVLQNYFLSSQYGRNWFYLFSSQHVSTGAVLGLAFGFFIGGWGGFLAWFAYISKRHPWWLPVFAIGLGAPRWAQMLWGTSSFGLYLPWAGSEVASALVSRSLWLWLGLLDAIQNTGFGLILLLTLTRIHVLVTLMIAQVLGSVATIVARATAPNNLGPGPVFPDFSKGLGVGISNAWFWVALVTQLAICVGFLKFFRKEQISKP